MRESFARSGGLDARTNRTILESNRGKERIAFRADFVNGAKKQNHEPSNDQDEGRSAGP